MAARSVRLELLDVAALRAEYASNLRAGGCFVAGATDLRTHDECELEIVHPATRGALRLAARVVWVSVDGPRPGVGLTLVGFSPELRAALERFVAASGVEADTVNTTAAEPSEPATDPLEEEPLDDPIAHQRALAQHERLRGLSAAEQLKVARGADAADRVLLERIYGKAVWVALIANPRLTPPEVARLARMGNLPVPQIEQIVANGAWLQSPQVRRALLSNPRLSQDLAVRVLRQLPSHELKLVPSQTTYPAAIRNLARRLLGR